MRYLRWIFCIGLSASLPMGCALLLHIPDSFVDGEETEGTEAVSASGAGGGAGSGGTVDMNCSEDSGINGCRAGQIIDLTAMDAGVSVEIGPPDASPICLRVANKVEVTFTNHENSCQLRGGSNGSVWSPEKNPIERKFDGGIPLKEFGQIGRIDAEPPCIPFFCEDDVENRQGVIFVQE